VSCQVPKCPKCSAEIDHLKNTTTEQQTYDFYPNEVTGGPYYELQDTEGAGDRHDSPFSCPVCGEELFHDETPALAFLRGEA